MFSLVQAAVGKCETCFLQSRVFPGQSSQENTSSDLVLLAAR